MTKKQLEERVAELENTISELKAEKAKLVDEVVALKNKWQEERNSKPNLPAGQPTAIRYKDDMVLGAMKWAIGRVGFKSLCSDEFLGGFECYRNQEGTWFAMYPKGSGGAAFIKEFLAACRAAGLKSNYWKNNGVFFEVK